MKRIIESIAAALFVAAMIGIIVLAVLFSDGKIGLGTYLVAQACVCVYCMGYVFWGGTHE